MGTEWNGEQARYLLGGLRKEDAAGSLLGLHQPLHQNPVQRRDQTLRHRRTPVPSRFLLAKQGKRTSAKLPQAPVASADCLGV
jgi:hypothetical protein